MTVDDSRLSDWNAKQAERGSKLAGGDARRSVHGDGRGDPMAQDERLTDAKIAAAEARTDTKFAQLIGKIDGLIQDISHLNRKVDDVNTRVRSTTALIITIIIGSAFSVLGLTFACVALFGNAMSTTASVLQSGLAAAGLLHH